MKKLNKVKFSLRQGLIEENETTPTYNGKPVPEWLQQPVFENDYKAKNEEIPAWVLKPVNFD